MKWRSSCLYTALLLVLSGCASINDLNLASDYVNKGDCKTAIKVSAEMAEKPFSIVPKRHRKFRANSIKLRCSEIKRDSEIRKQFLEEQERKKSPDYRLKRIRESEFYLGEISDPTIKEIEEGLIKYKSGRPKKNNKSPLTYLKTYMRDANITDDVIKLIFKHFPKKDQEETISLYTYGDGDYRSLGFSKGRNLDFQKFVINQDINLIRYIHAVHKDILKLDKVKTYLKENPLLGVYVSSQDDNFYKVRKPYSRTVGSSYKGGSSSSSSGGSTYQRRCRYEVYSTTVGGYYQQGRREVCD